MTNSEILANYRKELNCVNFKLRLLKSYSPRPEINNMISELEELRGNIELSIADLKGAIAAGADISVEY